MMDFVQAKIRHVTHAIAQGCYQRQILEAGFLIRFA